METSIAKLENSIERIFYLPFPNERINRLVEVLRLLSKDEDFTNHNLYIPSACEKNGFVEGNHNLGQLLHFLADMLEE
jgi:hypothetical protein